MGTREPEVWLLSNIGETVFTVGGFHFQLLTICKQFGSDFVFKTIFKNRPIGELPSHISM